MCWLQAAPNSVSAGDVERHCPLPMMPLSLHARRSVLLVNPTLVPMLVSCVEPTAISSWSLIRNVLLALTKSPTINVCMPVACSALITCSVCSSSMCWTTSCTSRTLRVVVGDCCICCRIQMRLPCCSLPQLLSSACTTLPNARECRPSYSFLFVPAFSAIVSSGPELRWL